MSTSKVTSLFPRKQKVKKETEYRCFTFGHYKLSSIQQGIQGGHALVELMLRYRDDKKQPEHYETVLEWAKEHKTLICKNGGNTESLEKIFKWCEEQEDYPWAFFEESDPDMAGMLTCVAIVLSDTIYEEGVKLLKDNNLEQLHKDGLYTIFNENGIPFEYTEFEWELMQWLIRCSLSR